MYALYSLMLVMHVFVHVCDACGLCMYAGMRACVSPCMHVCDVCLVVCMHVRIYFSCCFTCANVRASGACMYAVKHACVPYLHAWMQAMHVCLYVCM